MEKIFENKVALITGGTFGIGNATALLMAQKGAKVIIVDWLEDHEMMENFQKMGVELSFIKCDVSRSDQVKQLTEDVIKKFGKIDFAFNNAGIEGLSDITHECTEENWDRTLSINLKGIWLCMKYVLPHMEKVGKGSIVNTASVAGLIGFQGLPAYTASKHGIIGLTKTAALEYAKKGIRINAVCPGAIKTPMLDRFTGKKKEAEKKYEEMEPIGRLGQAEEVAKAVCWLFSDDASFVTGHAMAVDGGWSAQ